MNFITTFLLSFAMSFSAAHEFYLSVTDVTYVKEQEVFKSSQESLLMILKMYSKKDMTGEFF